MATKIGPKTVTQRDRSKNLVFCIDAAHADSYGGEPADNLFADPNNFGGADWNVKNGTWAAYSDPGPHGNGCYSCTATDSDPYAYSNYVRSVSTGNLTFSAWVKGVGGTIGMGGDIRINFGSSGGQATGSNETVTYTITGNWQKVQVTQNVTGAGTIKVGVEAPNGATAGHVVLVSDPQLEQSSTSAPFTATARTTSNAVKNISGVGAQGTTLTGTFATYGQELFRPTTRNVLASLDSKKGHIGGAYWDFDGSDEYIDLGSIAFGVKDITVALWFQIDAFDDDYADLFNNRTSSSGNAGFEIRQRTSGTKIQLIFDWGASSGVVNTGTLSTETWYHIVAALDRSGYLRGYLNGVEFGTPLDVSAHSATSITNDQSAKIGKDAYSNYWNGRAANCMIWEAALTAKEIKDIYIAQKGRFGK